MHMLQRQFLRQLRAPWARDACRIRSQRPSLALQRGFCYAVTTFGSDFERCAHSALLRSLYAYAERGEARDPNLAVVLVDARYLTDEPDAAAPVSPEEIVPMLREWTFGWPEMSFMGAVVDSSQFALPSVSVMLITDDESAFATVRNGERDDNVSIGRWHRPYTRSTAVEQMERQADAYFARRHEPPVLGERSWFSLIARARAFSMPDAPYGKDEESPGLRRLIAQSMTFQQLKETQESLALSSAQETFALTVQTVRDSLSPAELEEVEEMMLGHHPTRDDQQFARFVLAFGDTDFIRSDWLGETFPRARKLGLPIAQTPFVTGTPVTYFMDDAVYSSGGFAIAFAGLGAFQIPMTGTFQIGHFSLVKLGDTESAVVTKANGNMVLELEGDSMQRFMDAATNVSGKSKDLEFYAQINGTAMVRVLGGDPRSGRLALDGGSNLSLKPGDLLDFYYQVQEPPSGDYISDAGIVFNTIPSDGIRDPAKREEVLAGDRPGLFLGTSSQGVGIDMTGGAPWFCSAAGSSVVVPIAGNSVYPIDEPQAAFRPVHRQLGDWLSEKVSHVLPGPRNTELPKPDKPDSKDTNE